VLRLLYKAKEEMGDILTAAEFKDESAFRIVLEQMKYDNPL